MKFIVKYFSEITVKSKPVRRRLVDRLASNLRYASYPAESGTLEVKVYAP